MQICHLFLQHFETFDVSHVFLLLTIVELSTLKQVRFFGPPCSIGYGLCHHCLSWVCAPMYNV